MANCQQIVDDELVADVNRRLGLLATLAAALMAFTRVYIGAPTRGTSWADSPSARAWRCSVGCYWVAH